MTYKGDITNTVTYTDDVTNIVTYSGDVTNTAIPVSGESK